MTRDMKKWVVVRLGHMGDVVLATGVLDYLHKKHGFRFAFVTREPFAPLLRGHPAVDDVIPITPRDLSSLGNWISRAKNLAKQYKGHGLLDLHGTLRSHILSLLWSGPVRRYPKYTLVRRLYHAGNFGFARRILLKTNVPQRYALAFESTPPDPSALVPVIRISAEERSEARKLLSELGPGTGTDTGTGPVALHPYATHVNKAWPRYRWDELVTALRARDRDYVIIGKSDTPLKPKDPRDLTGRTDLRQTCALLKECAALVTGDSGPMHLAAGTATPAIALFGPTDQAWGFYPTGPNDIVLETEMECRPCSLHGKGECERGLACLADIGTDHVLDALETRP